MIFRKLKQAVMLVAVAAFATTAVADIDPKFYVGAGANYAKFGFNKEAEAGFKALANSNELKKKTRGLAAFVGTKLTPNFGVEVGFETFKKAKHTLALATNNLKTDVNNLYIDAMVYYPLADSLELVGTLGLARADIKTKGKLAGTDANYKQTKVGPRVGAGIQYNINDFSIRTMARWQKVGGTAKNGTDNISKTGLKDIKSVGLAVAYTF